MLAFVPPSRAVFSFLSLSCVRRVAAETSAEGSRLSTSISIHAPHVGSDRGGAGQGDGDAISIPAPRVGSDSCVADVGTGEREETRLLN